ncbi:hypothetical protein FBU59_000532 [Linderina macrospora]|uniref:Uncharacterized protein n=1 Tax=Linderina macrospora TaxID=4868 RepID=A0ACC1JGI8_9FUNG|nr:hypothetical protein FBU59_000532 [Linderina macrospora]
MRSLFSRNKKPKKSDESFDKLPDDYVPSYASEGNIDHANEETINKSFSKINLADNAPSVHNSSSRQRGLSNGSIGFAVNSVGRPISAVLSNQPHSPSHDLQLAQLEEELDTIMDEMGLEGEQRMSMKAMPVDSKLQLIQTHKMASHTQMRITPLSEHLKILTKAGTQSLPRSRLEKLRVDISYQSVQQIRNFIDEGGLKALLSHLVQLNSRKTAFRRQDEVMKENELLRCILGAIKVQVGAEYVTDGTSHLRHILNSVDMRWLQCSIVALRIITYLLQLQSIDCSDAVVAALFRNDDLSDPNNRRSAFVAWMETVESTVGEYGSVQGKDSLAESNIVEFISYTLMLIGAILDNNHDDLALRVKLYSKFGEYDMFAKFNSLRNWGVPVIDSHLNRWDEVLRRDYNIARSMKPGQIVMENGQDSSIMDSSAFTAFVERYERAREVQSDIQSDDDADSYLNMNVATYETPTAKFDTMRSVPPISHSDQHSPNSNTNNPFFSSLSNSPRPLSASAADQSQDIEAQKAFPFTMHNRSRSNVAETGSLRSLRAAGASPGPRAVVPPMTPAKSPAGPVTSVKSANVLLQKSLAAIANDGKGLAPGEAKELYRELLAISQVTQELLDTVELSEFGRK